MLHLSQHRSLLQPAGRFYRLLRDGDRDRHHHVHLSARGNEKRGGLENIKLMKELRHAVIEGPVHLLRPKLLTEGVAIIAIFPMDLQKHVGGEILTPTGWRVSWRAFDF